MSLDTRSLSYADIVGDPNDPTYSPNRALGSKSLAMVTHLTLEGNPPIENNRSDRPVRHEPVGVERLHALPRDIDIRNPRTFRTNEELIVECCDSRNHPRVV